MAGPVSNIKQSVNQQAQAAKASIQAAKNQSLTDMYMGLAPDDSIYDVIQGVNNQNTFTGEPKSPIVSQRNGVSKHADGTYSVLNADGNTIGGLDELTAKTYAVRDSTEQQAIDAFAPITGGGQTANALGQTVTDIGVTAASLTTGDTTLTGKIDVYNFQDKQRGKHARGAITSDDRAKYEAMSDRTELSTEEQTFRESDKYKKIAELDAEAKSNKSQFDAIEAFGNKVKANMPVNRADQAVAHKAFEVIAKNDGKLSAAWNAVTQDLDTFMGQGVDSIPYMIAFTAGGPITQAAVLGTLAIGKGNQAVEEFRTKNKREPDAKELSRIKMWAAAATVAEKFGDMLLTKAIPISKLKWAEGVKAKVDASLPASIANLTIVRPAIGLAGEGVSGGATEISEQIAQEGKVTNWDEVAFAATAEALGTPGGVAGMVAGNLALKATKGTIDAVTAKSRAEKLREVLATPDTVADTPEGAALNKRVENIIYQLDNFPENIASQVAIKEELESLEEQLGVTVEGALAPEDRAEAQAKYDALPDRVKPEGIEARRLAKEAKAKAKQDRKDAKVKTAEDIAKAAAKDTSDITPEDFATEIARISSDETPLQERVEAFVALKSRGMTTEQKKERAALADVLSKAAADFGNSSEPAPSLKPTKQGSHGIIDDDGTLGTDQEYDRTKLNNALTDSNSTEVDKVHAAAQIGAQDTRAKIEARNNGDMAGVATDVREGTNDRWLGFKTYVDQINKINQRIKSAVSEVEGSTIFQEVKSTLSKMKTHRDNMANKTAALKKAMDASVKDGTPRYVRGNKGAGYNFKTNRVMEYIDPITAQEAELGRDLTTDERTKANEELAAAYKNRKTSGEYIYRLDANDAASQILIDTVTDEATYGDYMVTAAETHSQTSYAKTAGLNARDKAKLEKQIDDINNEAPIVEDTDKASDEEIDDALDNLDTPGETNNDSANETSTNETSSTNDSDNTTEEGDSLGENPPPADGPETTTVQEPVENVSGIIGTFKNFINTSGNIGKEYVEGEGAHNAEAGYTYHVIRGDEANTIRSSGVVAPRSDDGSVVWSRTDGLLWYGKGYDGRLIRVKNTEISKDTPVDATVVEIWDSNTNTFSPIIEAVSEKPTTEEAGTVTLATLTPEDIFSQSELGNLENILGISEEDIQDYIDNPEKLGRQIGDLDQIDLREDGAAAQAELDAEIAALDKIWAKMRSVMTAAETKQFVPDQKSFEERFDENQQDDLAAEQDVLEEEVYDPSILTTEERIVEAMNNDTALADSPNTSSETIKEYNALKKELDELNQIIRCLKT
jgi:hypothetical protein